MTDLFIHVTWLCAGCHTWGAWSGQRWGVGVVTRLDHQLLRLYSGFEGQEVSGSESPRPSLTVVLVDF